MAAEGDSVMWLRVEDEDIGAAELLRVTVNENTTGSGKRRRTSFVCTGTLHKGEEERMEEYGRAQKKVKADPRIDEGLQLELQRDMMANFRRQKREREADNLVDSEEDDDDGGEHLCFLHPPPFIPPMLRPRFSRTFNPALTLIVPSLALLISNFSGGRRRSKRAVKEVETLNMGPENRWPSQQIGTAQGAALSPLSSSSSSSSSFSS